MSASVYIFSLILFNSAKLILTRHNAPYIDVPPSGFDANWAEFSGENEDNIPPEYLHLFDHYFSDNYASTYASDENTALLRFFYNSRSNYTELPFKDAHKIFSHSWYDPSKTTVFFSHGYTGYPDGPAVTAIINFFLEEGKSNVVLLNWKEMAAMVYPSFVNSYLNWAAPNTIKCSRAGFGGSCASILAYQGHYGLHYKLGHEFTNTLLNLSAAGLDLNKTHLVGHSLGAHMFGVTGNKMQELGVKLPWITGLDPAAAVFDAKPAFSRLNGNSAIFVDVIHSDPNKYGSRRELGLVDFWPNYKNRGQVVQTGCPPGSHPRFTKEDLCNHNRSWQLLLDALKYPGTLIGSHARSFRIWKNYSKDERNADVLELGTFNPNAKPGNYYFITGGESPFGLGKDGL